MALEATHIKFALDVKKQFDVQDECDYIRGAVYPDSRYVTGIDREKTHTLEAHTNDFQHGWYTHILYDSAQYDVISDLFPEIEGADDEWTKRTAIKILQDIKDANSFDPSLYTDCLSESETPQGESDEQMQFYHHTLQKLYETPDRLTVNSYRLLWNEWSLDKDVGERVIQQAKVYRENTPAMRKVGKIHGESLSSVQFRT